MKPLCLNADDKPGPVRSGLVALLASCFWHSAFLHSAFCILSRVVCCGALVGEQITEDRGSTIVAVWGYTGLPRGTTGRAPFG